MASTAIRNAVHCRDCGELISPNATTCPRCGGRQSLVSSNGRKSRAAAIILALVLGGLGVHKFYLGRVAQGLFYLLFFWTFIPAVIAFVEMIIYLTMSDEDFARKYG